MTSRPDRTLYQTMGVSPTAAPAEIRDAYLRLARALHPDRYLDGSPAERSLAERRMREVNAAWDVLGRPASRATYDADLASRSRSPSNASSRPATTNGSARPRPPDGLRADGDELDDDDDVELAPFTAFLLRRGAIIVFLFVALGLFVGSALARRDPPPPTVLDCTGGTCTSQPEPGTERR